MKNILFTAALCAGIAAAGAARADRWVEPINGTLSAIMVPDGDVMMKIQIPSAEYTAIAGMMKAGKKTCTVFHPSFTTVPPSLILVCGPTRELIQGY
jgi:hypothetical protein